MNKQLILIFLFFSIFTARTGAQLITMSNKCYDRVKLGNKQLDSTNFKSALSTFDAVLANCTTKDAKEQGNLGRARALNGLKRYDDAIANASASITASKKSNVMAYYTRSFAYKKTGKLDSARADLEQVTALTAKNKDVKARATMFAQLADVDASQGMLPEARDNLAKAIQIDPNNPSFYVQRGDLAARQNNYGEAFTDYDRAVSMGKADADMYQIRTNARIRQMQHKYNTTNASDLARKMTATEKEQVCKELNKASSLGMRNMQLDLFSTMICK